LALSTNSFEPGERGGFVLAPEAFESELDGMAGTGSCNGCGLDRVRFCRNCGADAEPFNAGSFTPAASDVDRFALANFAPNCSDAEALRGGSFTAFGSDAEPFNVGNFTSICTSSDPEDKFLKGSQMESFHGRGCSASVLSDLLLLPGDFLCCGDRRGLARIGFAPAISAPFRFTWITLPSSSLVRLDQ
jgi:hypothetical protein